MLVFSTRLPLNDSITRQQILQLCLDWISGSPHYDVHDLHYDPVSLNDADYANDTLNISIRNYTDETCALSAFRLLSL